MAATVQFRSYHGATPDAGTDITSTTFKFKAADNDTNDASAPLVVPTSSTIGSYVKQFALYAQTSPSNLINNCRFYSDGGNGYGTGVALVGRTFAAITGTAASGTTTVLTTAGGLTSGALVGYVLEITAGTNSGQARRISSNTTVDITVASAFSSAIDNTSVYRIWYLDPINNAQTLLTGTTDVFTWTSGSPLTVGGSIANPNTGRITDAVQLQMTVASTASAGNTPNETFTFAYDES